VCAANEARHAPPPSQAFRAGSYILRVYQVFNDEDQVLMKISLCALLLLIALGRIGGSASGQSATGAAPTGDPRKGYQAMLDRYRAGTLEYAEMPPLANMHRSAEQDRGLR